MDNLDQHLDRLDRPFSLLRRHLAASLASAGLSGAQYLMLRYLTESGPTNPTVLAEAFGVSLSSITNTVKRMVRDGLVRRYEDETNRRYVLVEVTDKGRQLLEQTETERRRILRAIFGKLSNEELNMFTELVQKLADQ